MSDPSVPPAPPTPEIDEPRPSRMRRVASKAWKLAAGALAFYLLFVAVDFGLEWATYRSSIPRSCREPSGIEYSQVGPLDYGPYVVKLKTWDHLPWGTSRSAIVGPGLSNGFAVTDRGVHVAVTSERIGSYRCRWTDRGVTIIEPGNGSEPGLEHFVPAEQFLGGR